MFLVAPSFENVEVEVLVLPGFQALCKMWYVKRILEISHVKINGQQQGLQRPLSPDSLRIVKVRGMLVGTNASAH